MARIRQSPALGLGLSLWQTLGVLLAGILMALGGWYSLRSDITPAEREGKNGSVHHFQVEHLGQEEIEVRFTCPLPRSVHISVYHLSGNEVHHVQMDSSKQAIVPISTKSWAPGLYIVQLNTGLDVLKRRVRI